jgi:hypothetical protein
MSAWSKLTFSLQRSPTMSLKSETSLEAAHAGGEVQYLT